MISIDQICYRSGLRRTNAETKFAFSLMTLCICVFSRSIDISLFVLVVNSWLNIRKGHLSVQRYLKLLSVPFIFLLFSTAAILFRISREPSDLFAVPLGNWFLTADHDTFFYAAALILTALASVSCLYFLSLNTPFPDILETLKKLRCPKLLIELMLLTYRFIFILSDTASAITVSQNCRLGDRDFRASLRSFGQMASMLMIRAAERSRKLYTAMEARCYDGVLCVLSESAPPKRTEVAAVIAFDGILLLCAIFRRFF